MTCSRKRTSVWPFNDTFRETFHKSFLTKYTEVFRSTGSVGDRHFIRYFRKSATSEMAIYLLLTELRISYLKWFGTCYFICYSLKFVTFESGTSENLCSYCFLTYTHQCSSVPTLNNKRMTNNTCRLPTMFSEGTRGNVECISDFDFAFLMKLIARDGEKAFFIMWVRGCNGRSRDGRVVRLPHGWKPARRSAGLH